MVFLVTCIFSYFEARNNMNNAFEVQFFSGLHFYTLSQTVVACRAMQLCFFFIFFFIKSGNIVK